MNYPRILENLMRAIALVEATKEELLDLQLFKGREIHCGTLHCTAGLLTTDKHFAAQGMFLEKAHGWGGATVILGNPLDTPLDKRYNWLDELFGPDAFDNLFFEYGDGKVDEELNAYVPDPRNDYGDDDFIPVHTMSDKQLALARLRHQLAAMVKAATETPPPVPV